MMDPEANRTEANIQRLRVGTRYHLFDLHHKLDQKSFNGIYIGRNDVDNNSFIDKINPEGNIFVRLNREKQVEVYCDFRREPTAELEWYESENGVMRPAGFRVILFSKGIEKVSGMIPYLSEMGGNS